MIQPIKQSTGFMGASKVPEVYKSVANTKPQVVPSQKTQSKEVVTVKKSFGEKLHSIKIGFMNIIKGFNNVKGTGAGFVKGVAEGAIGGAIVGTIGKNIVSNERDIFKTLGGTVADITGTAWKVIKHIPDLLTKAPIENLKTAVSLPTRFFKYMKNPAVIAVSSAVAMGLIAFRTIQGKINANKANANLDHAINEGHIPTK